MPLSDLNKPMSERTRKNLLRVVLVVFGAVFAALLVSAYLDTRRLPDAITHHDQETLAEIAILDSDADVRRQALDNLSDQMQLMRVAQSVRDVPERMAAFRKITSQKVIAQIAASLGNDEDPVKKAAWEKLTDQAEIERLVWAPGERETQNAAIDKLQGQQALMRVAQKHPRTSLRAAAIARVRDQEFLFRHSQTDPSNAVRDSALTLMDEAHFARVAVENDDSMLRLKARDHLQGAALAAAERFETWLEAQDTAIEKTQDQDELARIALTAKFTTMRVTAAQHLRSPQALLTVALKCSELFACGSAIDRLSDPAALRDVAAHAAFGGARVCASVKAGLTTWERLLADANKPPFDRTKLVNTLAGLTMVPRQKELSGYVLTAAEHLMAVDDGASTVVLVALFDVYSNQEFASTYLKSGDPDLADIAVRRGWILTTYTVHR